MLESRKLSANAIILTMPKPSVTFSYCYSHGTIFAIWHRICTTISKNYITSIIFLGVDLFKRLKLHVYQLFYNNLSLKFKCIIVRNIICYYVCVGVTQRGTRRADEQNTESQLPTINVGSRVVINYLFQQYYMYGYIYVCTFVRASMDIPYRNYLSHNIIPTHKLTAYTL